LLLVAVTIAASLPLLPIAVTVSSSLPLSVTKNLWSHHWIKSRSNIQTIKKMQKLFSIILSVAATAFLSIIVSADAEQSRAWKMTRMDKPLTTTKNRGNPVNLNPAAADAFAYWIPE